MHPIDVNVLPSINKGSLLSFTLLYPYFTSMNEAQLWCVRRNGIIDWLVLKLKVYAARRGSLSMSNGSVLSYTIKTH